MSILCEKCKNESICKYCKEMEEMSLKVNEIINKKDACSPIRLDLKCVKFEEKNNTFNNRINSKTDNIFIKK